ncbi:MAG: DEAD/DEAH box helicase family protein [Armatimonadota bacterium]|nr:DEAD/DEAH box helicase family protein [Armatimonadota bacterium]
MAELTVEEILGPEGLLARRIPGFEFRHEQMEMAEAVADALARHQHCLAEAGTGVGKTFAYLAAVLPHLKKRKTILSTHTIGLQDQLTEKDLPTLKAALPEAPFTSAVLKGMGNYLCLQNLDGAAQLGLFDPDSARRLNEWARQTETGDVAELGQTLPGWQEVCATSESCRRQRCPYYDRCFLFRAREKAASADLVVVNHALFFSDLLLRAVDPGLSLLPDYDVVIFDEAHHLEDVAGRCYGVEFSNYRVSYLVSRVGRLHGVDVPLAALERLDQANRRLFDLFLDAGRDECFLDEALELAGRGPVVEAAQTLITELENVGTALLRAARDVPDPNARARVEGYARAARNQREELQAIFGTPPEGPAKRCP